MTAEIPPAPDETPEQAAAQLAAYCRECSGEYRGPLPPELAGAGGQLAGDRVLASGQTRGI